jgi:hypothetical protein
VEARGDGGTMVLSAQQGENERIRERTFAERRFRNKVFEVLLRCTVRLPQERLCTDMLKPVSVPFLQGLQNEERKRSVEKKGREEKERQRTSSIGVYRYASSIAMTFFTFGSSKYARESPPAPARQNQKSTSACFVGKKGEESNAPAQVSTTTTSSILSTPHCLTKSLAASSLTNDGRFLTAGTFANC